MERLGRISVEATYFNGNISQPFWYLSGWYFCFFQCHSHRKQTTTKEYFIFCLCSSKCLQIERDTFGKLQCHPYPHEYVDTTKQCAHCAFFMGLQRKQGETIQEGQQFDIRGTVDEFRHSINMYLFWKPGMEIYVSHVRRRQIPSYVFPDGYKRPRPSRFTTQQADKSPCEDGGVHGIGSGERYLKRKKDPGELDNSLGTPGKQQSISPMREDSISPELIGNKLSSASPDCLASRLEQIETAIESGKACQVNSGLVSDGLHAGTHSVEGEMRWMHGDKESNMELVVPHRRILCPETEPGCASNSSVVTNVTSDGSSCEDVGFESVAGNGEVNTGSSEGSVQGNDNPISLLGDSCEAESEPLLKNGIEGNQVFQDGTQETLEVLN